MRKTIILLSLTLIIATVAATMASRARMTMIVYTRDLLNENNICSVFYTDHATLMAFPFSTVMATTLSGAPCISAQVVPILND
ncbi:hypothetical protein [Chitinophaga sp.]|uniref:hypothetical protein n=1 Tax=Chitinophaga sp. TaxID=1869181 RepID=UPI0031D42E50